MPWKISDVDKFKKGLTDQQKEKWVQIANNTRKQCIAKGGDELDCDVAAVRTANALIDGKKVAANFAENPLRKISTQERLLFSEIAEETGDFQTAFPVGLYHTGKYGEVIVTPSFVKKMEQNGREFGVHKLYMDTEHDYGQANAWAEDITADENGIKIKWNYTARGRELIADRRYRYFSAALGSYADLETGEERYPFLIAVSLTNNPVMYNLPEAHLGNFPAHSDGAIDKKRGKKMNDLENENLENAGTSSSEKQPELSDNAALMAENAKMKGEMEILKETVNQLAQTIKTRAAIEQAEKKTALITEALENGRITPKDKALWEGRFDKNPDLTAEILNTLPPIVDFTVYGRRGQPDDLLDSEDIAAAKLLNMSLDDYKKYKPKEG